LIIFIAFVVWAETPSSPMIEAIDALESDSDVFVANTDWLVFQPKNFNKSVGFVIYPGGRVDFRSYSPLAHRIANNGYPVIIVRMPLNLAFLGVNKANDIISSYSEISYWAIGGHSLGGAMAAQFVYENPSKVEGLILLASYPASGVNLSKYDLLVTTIHGTNDGLVSDNQIENTLNLLPASTTLIEIDGGNHAQFGWYGNQEGDNQATITRKEQQNQTFDAIITLLHALENH
jgi:pimeloyl-ACP methyl ester carboxylesterase